MTISTRNADPFVTFAQFAGIAALTAIVVAGASYFPIRSAYGETVVAAVLFGVAVSLVGSWLSAIPIVLTMNRTPILFASGALGNLGVRFAVTVALALTIRAFDVVANDPFLISVAVSQLVFLAVDVLGITRLAHRLPGGRV